MSEETQHDQKTMAICLNEIARCRRLSPQPNFIALLGDRYGWQPLPEIVPSAEMNQIVMAVTAAGKGLLEEWYGLDRNAVPEEYYLRSREASYKKMDR